MADTAGMKNGRAVLHRAAEFTKADSMAKRHGKTGCHCLRNSRNCIYQMKTTEDVRKFAAEQGIAGMKAKSKEFEE